MTGGYLLREDCFMGKSSARSDMRQKCAAETEQQTRKLEIDKIFLQTQPSEWTCPFKTVWPCLWACQAENLAELTLVPPDKKSSLVYAHEEM